MHAQSEFSMQSDIVVEVHCLNLAWNSVYNRDYGILVSPSE